MNTNTREIGVDWEEGTEGMMSMGVGESESKTRDSMRRHLPEHNS